MYQNPLCSKQLSLVSPVFLAALHNFSENNLWPNITASSASHRCGSVLRATSGCAQNIRPTCYFKNSQALCVRAYQFVVIDWEIKLAQVAARGSIPVLLGEYCKWRARNSTVFAFLPSGMQIRVCWNVTLPQSREKSTWECEWQCYIINY